MEQVKITKHTIERNYLFDTLKGVGILLVIFGHLIEQMTTPTAEAIYKIIYIFHMPLFIVISGYFARFNWKKILTHLLIPYLILQVIFTPIEFIALKPKLDILFILRPKWLLWFLFALIIWKISLLLIDKLKKYLPIIIAVSFVVGLVFGFLKFDGFILSISRLVVFYPFFLLGYHFKQNGFITKLGAINKWWKITLIALSFICFILIFVLFPHTPKNAFYGSLNYHQLPHYTIFFRLFNYIGATIITLTLLSITPKTKTPIAFFGKQSFTLYIGHAPFGMPIALLLAKIASSYIVLLAFPLTALIVLIILTARQLYIRYNPFKKHTSQKLLVNTDSKPTTRLEKTTK